MPHRHADCGAAMCQMPPSPVASGCLNCPRRTSRPTVPRPPAHRTQRGRSGTRAPQPRRQHVPHQDRHRGSACPSRPQQAHLLPPPQRCAHAAAARRCMAAARGGTTGPAAPACAPAPPKRMPRVPSHDTRSAHTSAAVMRVAGSYRRQRASSARAPAGAPGTTSAHGLRAQGDGERSPLR